MQDLRFAFRSLLKTPGFTSIAVVTMAIAIGACTALFSVLQAVVLRPLPFPDPDSIVSIWAINTERNIEAPAISWSKHEAFRERKDVFADFVMTANSSLTITDGSGEPEQVSALHASAGFMKMFELQPAAGRHFAADEDVEGATDVVMLSHRIWKNRYSGDPGIIGRTVQIDGVARVVVGVLPARMPVPFNQVELLVPRPLELPYLSPQQRNNAITHQAYARLASGLSLEQAQLRTDEMAAQFKAANPSHIDAPNRSQLRLLSQQVLGDLDRTFWTLAGAVGAVLLIACANIANLFLARVSARQKEIAVRMSLGARRREVVRQFVAESTVFSLAAGVLGVLLASWSLQGIVALAGSQLPRADEIGLDPVVLSFSLVTALVSGLLIGVYPALQASRTDVQVVLRDTSRGAGGGAAAKSFRRLLVVAQVALSLTLLICAGLLVRSFYNLQTSSLGFEVEGRAFGQVNLPGARYTGAEASREFYRRLQDRMREAPELESGGVIFGMPLTGIASISPFAVQGRPVPPVHERILGGNRFVSVDYFAAMGIKLLEGRFFNDADRHGAERVVILNEAHARKLFPGESAIDKVLLLGANADILARVVGVIRDVKTAGVSAQPPNEIYSPRNQTGGAFMVLVARAKPGMRSESVLPVLRRILNELDPSLALANPQTLGALVNQSISVQRVTLALLLSFAGIAALLAAVGIYSVMAYAVTQRTGEIGVRMALGASSANILNLILKAGAVQVGAGLALGLVGAFAASRLLTGNLYEVKPFDPAVFGAVAAFFAVVALLACLIPARRATRVDPMVALRSE